MNESAYLLEPGSPSSFFLFVFLLKNVTQHKIMSLRIWIFKSYLFTVCLKLVSVLKWTLPMFNFNYLQNVGCRNLCRWTRKNICIYDLSTFYCTMLNVIRFWIAGSDGPSRLEIIIKNISVSTLKELGKKTISVFADFVNLINYKNNGTLLGGRWPWQLWNGTNSI